MLHLLLLLSLLVSFIYTTTIVCSKANKAVPEERAVEPTASDSFINKMGQMARTPVEDDSSAVIVVQDEDTLGKPIPKSRLNKETRKSKEKLPKSDEKIQNSREQLSTEDLKVPSGKNKRVRFNLKKVGGKGAQRSIMEETTRSFSPSKRNDGGICFVSGDTTE